MYDFMLRYSSVTWLALKLRITPRTAPGNDAYRQLELANTHANIMVKLSRVHNSIQVLPQIKLSTKP